MASRLDMKQSAMAACELLRTRFPGRIAFAADTNYYTEMQKSW